MPIKRSHAKVAVGLFWPKVGYFGHIFKISTFSVIFHLILILFSKLLVFFETNRIMTRSKLYILRCRFWFLAPCLLRGLKWTTLCTRTQNKSKIVGRVLAFPFNSYLKIEAVIFMFVTCKLSVKVLKIR